MECKKISHHNLTVALHKLKYRKTRNLQKFKLICTALVSFFPLEIHLLIYLDQRQWERMEFLGIDFSCALGSLRHGNIPDKDCLLPLISKLLGYCIVAASTTVKLPQARLIHIYTLIYNHVFDFSYLTHNLGFDFTSLLMSSCPMFLIQHLMFGIWGSQWILSST